MKKQQLIESRPNYFYGQLLLEKDFLDEQQYHINARRRYNLKLHGSGVVSGLKLDRVNETSFTVQPGIAIDESGQDIFLDRTEVFDLSEEFGANDVVHVSLSRQDAAKEDAAKTGSIDVYAVVTASKIGELNGGVLLATVRLDGQGKLGPDSLDYSRTRYAGKLLTPASVGPIELATVLKTGWIRLPFHPVALANVPEGETEIPPAFRVGPTEAVSPRVEGSEGKKDIGAAGTMPVTLPFSVTRILRFRIAGSRNEGTISLRLLKGGWDPKKMDHVNETLVEAEVAGVPFLETFDVRNAAVDPEYSTLSLWLRCTKRAAISLIAIEVGY
ncbi:MAG: hypothetical protein ACU841_10485 [Gammaproteobacteria bacterium]